MKLSVAPISLVTMISWYRFWISRRIVLPMINKTAQANRIVMMTTPAAESFDPRLIWDGSEKDETSVEAVPEADGSLTEELTEERT